MTVLGRNIIAASKLAKQFSTSAAKQGGWHAIPPPGHNLPFQIQNRYRLTLIMSLFFGSGFFTPFFAVRHQLKKNAN